MEELETIVGVNNAILLRIVEQFRAAGRTFLMPPPGTELQATTVIYISHESLMRVWRRMSEWVEQEAHWRASTAGRADGFALACRESPTLPDP